MSAVATDAASDRRAMPSRSLPASSRDLDASLSAWLDAVRALTACYVVLHHVASAQGWLHGPGLILRFGQEAVIVFFLLSGFVIFASERTRALRPYGYYLRRLRRIYPMLLLAMLVSTLVALDNGDLAARFDWRALAGTLFGMQDVSALKPGVVIDPYLGNFPLWSLSYEIAFYIVFPPVLIAWTRWPRAVGHAVGLACCASYVVYLIHPNHVALVGAYFLIWWGGAMAASAHVVDRRGFGFDEPVLAWLLALTGVAAIGVACLGYRGAGVYPILPLRHFAMATIVLAVLSRLSGRFTVGRRVPAARWFAAIAAISYALYVLHYPLLVDWYRAQTATGLIGAAIMLVTLCYLVERHLDQRIPAAPRD